VTAKSVHLTGPWVSVNYECLANSHDQFFFFWRRGPSGAMDSSVMKFLDPTQRRTTVGSTPMDEWSARRRDPYLTTHNTRNRQTLMPLAGFEPIIPASERPQTNTLDRAITGIGERKSK
jgi:hypothetical protein